ncbi:unnamed protein product [Ectocarpus sp. 12 AP-2014]
MSASGDSPDNPSQGNPQDVGEEMVSVQTQLYQLTILVKSLVEQRGEQVESSVSFAAAAPGSGGTSRVHWCASIGCHWQECGR